MPMSFPPIREAVEKPCSDILLSLGSEVVYTFVAVLNHPFIESLPGIFKIASSITAIFIFFPVNPLFHTDETFNNFKYSLTLVFVHTYTSYILL